MTDNNQAANEQASNQEPMMSGVEFQRRRVARPTEERRPSSAGEWAARLARGAEERSSVVGIVPGFDPVQDPDQAASVEGPPEGWMHPEPTLTSTSASPTAAGPVSPMTAQDFLARRHATDGPGPATWGWRGWVRRASRGLIEPRMGKDELHHMRARESVQRSFSGPRTIVFVNPKGGGVKTTSTLLAGMTFGTTRGGGVVAWDNNETRGTLGLRAEGANHGNTARELLAHVEEFRDVMRARVGDLAAFVRRQGDAHFDVLASDERPQVTGQISADDFTAVHEVLQRFYPMILIDTGNNLRAQNWLAAAEAADLIVLTSSMKEDVGYSGLWMLDALENSGYPNLKDRVVTVLSQTESADARLSQDLIEAYASRTRSVFTIPYDPALQAGSRVRYDRLSPATSGAWLQACAEMARAL